MPNRGIYTLANDTVYDQLVALLNSIETNVGPDIPICVIPYNDNLERVQRDLKTRPNVTLFEDWQALKRWDDFIKRVWESHPRARQSKMSRPGWYGGFVHRKFAAFDGPFEEFIFYDADSLAMKPADDIFERLNHYDLIFNDWEHAKSRAKTELDLDVVERATHLSEAELKPKLHCDSFFGSKRGFFNPEELALLEERLIKKGEIQWVKSSSWWSSSGLFSYMTLAIERPMFNFTLSPNGYERTGNCANADPFKTVNHVLVNAEGLKPIHRIHYMGYPSEDFTRLCQGEDANIAYKEIFLHYRFLNEPDQKPEILKPPSATTKLNRKIQKAIKKLKRTIA